MPADLPDDSPDPTPDPVVEALERYLLGGPRSLTRQEVADRAGVPIERAEALWRALGFSRTSDDDVFFGYADVRAVQLAAQLSEIGAIDPAQETAIVRTAGRSFARLAEWQTRLVAEVFSGDEEITADDALAMAEQVVPVLEELQSYVWRRHVLAATSRLLLRAGEESTTLAVGFADIVGYTSQSRRLSQAELERLVEHFEDLTNRIVSNHGGRIIKTIGDEVLFVTDAPLDAAEIALELVEAHDADESFPRVRVGLAYGPVLPRLGDVYGSVVNLAARLTGIARPGRVLVDRELGSALADQPGLVVRRTRRASVKGYERLEPSRLKRARPEGRHAAR